MMSLSVFIILPVCSSDPERELHYEPAAGVTCSPEVQLLSPPSPELQFLLTRKIKTKRKHTLSRWARGTVTDLQRTEAQPISVHNLKAQGFREGEGGIRRQHKEWREEGFA